jgi:predicted nucleic acid-binding protein
MQIIINVYLDTNIIIKGSASKENHVLIELFKKGKIKLFVSQKVTMERRERSSRQQDRIDQLLRNEKSLGADIFSKLFKEAVNERERFKNLEKAELIFWMQVRPENAKSTFAGLILFGQVGPDLIELLDIKNERKLLGELLDLHKISDADAFHLMEAHSAEMDYFLTWDKKLIIKASQVTWLKPKVMMGSVRYSV